MRAGRLRNRVAILRATLTNDGRGGQSRAWSQVATVSGEILPMSAREQELAQRIVASVTHHYTVRYSPATSSLTPKETRLWCGGKTYEIASVIDEDARHRVLSGDAIEVAA
ncbi:MAG TPA: phage head closure protein [Vicinamibacterales bacterium]|nr:phage head closure protein [Vicinamibacterales bacterium]